MRLSSKQARPYSTGVGIDRSLFVLREDTMPRATAQVAETTRHELKTCPGGFVELRRMTYGQVVERRALMKLSVTAKKGQKDLAGEMAMANAAITQYEFRHCIVDHNLEDDNGQKLNLSSSVGFSSLDPRIGQEIEKRIGEMNNFEEEDDEGN
jgi:hypothetical protein